MVHTSWQAHSQLLSPTGPTFFFNLEQRDHTRPISIQAGCAHLQAELPTFGLNRHAAVFGTPSATLAPSVLNQRLRGSVSFGSDAPNVNRPCAPSLLEVSTIGVSTLLAASSIKRRLGPSKKRQLGSHQVELSVAIESC
ncbi:hypothetical protein CBOM_02058 [Ceraceosorus bombacis]|uniref:Uncharacterized protein n=1 Tax=Ceraceosorus bombacis TaxID=401625 RepID=A0A0P1BE39_9BASI|nr:hypothetical protein CBOM_02058 [Ceraceosorus bombacis]